MKYLTVCESIEKEFEASRPSIAACKSFTYFYSKKNDNTIKSLNITVYTIGLKEPKTYSVFYGQSKNPFYAKKPIALKL